MSKESPLQFYNKETSKLPLQTQVAIFNSMQQNWFQNSTYSMDIWNKQNDKGDTLPLHFASTYVMWRTPWSRGEPTWRFTKCQVAEVGTEGHAPDFQL
jgi:hypothetical protein